MNIYLENKIFTHIYKKIILFMNDKENKPSIDYARRCGEILKIQFHLSKFYFAKF
jgi:hypothetical protein